MKNEYKKVSLPQVGVNEDHGKLIKWLISEGQYVNAGTIICEFETTKTVIEIEVEHEGYIVPIAKESTELKVGDIIAFLIADKKNIDIVKSKFEKEVDEKVKISSEYKLTKKAKVLIDKYDIDINSLLLEKSIIRTEDILPLLNQSEELIKDYKIKINSNKEPLIIYGSGKGAITLFEAIESSSDFEIICFIDDDKFHKKSLLNLPVFHSSELGALKKEYGFKYAACEIANGKTRMRIKKSIERLGIQLINIFHPKSYVSKSAILGEGNYIKSAAIIETGTTIGDCCIIDNGVVIAHDNKIGDGCHIAPGVSFGSSISIDDFCVIGIGASIATNIKIGKNSIISVGSSVTKDVPENSIIEGTPGKIIGKVKN